MDLWYCLEIPAVAIAGPIIVYRICAFQVHRRMYCRRWVPLSGNVFCKRCAGHHHGSWASAMRKAELKANRKARKANRKPQRR
jgi:hypothetical protein